VEAEAQFPYPTGRCCSFTRNCALNSFRLCVLNTSDPLKKKKILLNILKYLMMSVLFIDI